MFSSVGTEDVLVWLARVVFILAIIGLITFRAKSVKYQSRLRRAVGWLVTLWFGLFLMALVFHAIKLA